MYSENWPPKKRQNPVFSCLSARCTPHPSVQKSEIWHVGVICMWVAAVKSDFYVFRKLGAWRPKNRQNPFFSCLFARCTPHPSVQKSEIWHAGVICMWVAAVKSDFYVFRKLGAWRPKNRQNPFFPVCSHAVRHALRCRNLKFGMQVSFVCGLLPIRVIFMYTKNWALGDPKTVKTPFFSSPSARCAPHPSVQKP